MEIVVLNIPLRLSDNEELAFKKALKKAGISKNQVKEICIYKKSADARRGEVRFICSVKITLKEKADYSPKGNDVRILKSFEYSFAGKGTSLPTRPVIIGAGPAGLFCAYLLCLYNARPIVIERGGTVEERIEKINSFVHHGRLDTDCNIQFGEGGAGTFSDGKLTTGISDARCGFVLNTFVKFGAPPEILKEAKPHIGTDYLRRIIVRMRKEIISMGGEFYFNEKVTDFIVKNGSIKAVITDKNRIDSDIFVLASGHSARDIYEKLNSLNVAMEKKPFSVGLRIEHLRETVDKMRYHGYAGHPALNAADYKLSYRDNGRGVYTFCMCPGGEVVAAASEENTVVVNGMSNYSRDNINSNSAVVVSVDGRDLDENLLSGMYFQRELEKKAFMLGGGDYSAPVQLVEDFLRSQKTVSLKDVKPTYPIGYNYADFNLLFPKFISDAMKAGLNDFNRKMSGFCENGAVFTGVETRTSAPVRIIRGDEGKSESFDNLYPCGEGAGYAGGIMSAAADGLKIAEKILNL